MAINFLDAITVNSGTGNASTIIASGTRPVTITGGAIGSVVIGGSTGGWSTGYFFKGSSGTSRGGFGALGNVDTVSYFWIGDAYNDTTMVIKPNAGNVGIGTTNPSEKLEVAGKIKITGTANFIDTTRNASSQANYIRFNDSSTSSVEAYLGFTSNNRDFKVNSANGSGTITLQAGGNTAVRISDSGDVGIGTTSPSKKLHVKESNSSTYAAYIENTVAGGDYLAMVGDAGDNVFEFLSSGTGGEAEMKMYSDGVLKADINADGNSYFNGGNVGIGTTSPTEKLHVKTSGVEVAKYETTATADLAIELANSQGSMFFGLGGGEQFGVGTTSDLNGTGNLFIIEQGGNVGIGTTSPSDGDLTIGAPRLHVAVGGTSGTFNLAARFQSTTSDADNTGTSILINSLNDRGLLIKAGRKDGDREVAYFDLVTSIGNTTNMLTMGKFSSAYNVGIGTTSPSQKLTVNGTIMSTGASNPQLILQDSTHSDITIKGDSGIFSVTNQSAGQNITMLYNGNTGIGTTSPTEKLEVAGNAKATSVRATGGADGGFVLRQWTHSSGYASLATNGMSGYEYCVLSDGTDTFISSGTNGTTRLRGPANDNAPQLEMTSTLCKVDNGDFKVEDGSIAVGTITNSTTNGRIDASNDIVAYSTSDIRLKDNIKNIDKALDKVNSIQGIEFDWIENEEVHGNSGHDVGVIAQEIEKVLPDVVTTRDSGYKAVKYEKIVPLLIEAIKDLSKQVDGLKRLI